MSVTLPSDAINLARNNGSLIKLTEAQYEKIRSEANGQYILSSLISRIMELPPDKCDMGGKNLLTHRTLSEISGRQSAVVFYKGDEDPKQIEAAFSVNDDSDNRNVWNTFNNAQLTYLTPYVNFYSRFTDNNGSNPQTQVIPLQSVHPSIDTVGSNYGVSNSLFGFLGLKNIDIELAGKYEETKYSDIKVEATFAANSLHVLDSETYLPLVVPHYSKNNMMGHQLIMEYGWNNPSPAAKSSLKFTRAQIQELKQQRQKYILYYYKHNISVDQDGSFTLVVNYIARATSVIQNIDLGTPMGEDFENLYGKDTYTGTSKSMKKVGYLDVDDFNSKIYKYIEDTHPGARERERSIITQYFHTMANSTTDARTLNKLFTARKQAIRELAFEKLQRIPQYLRDNSCEFLITIPHVNKNAHFLRSACISAQMDLLAKSDPHPKESVFPVNMTVALRTLGINSPEVKVSNKVDFYHHSSIAGWGPDGSPDGDISSGPLVAGSKVFDFHLQTYAKLGTEVYPNNIASRPRLPEYANNTKVMTYTFSAKKYWDDGRINLDTNPGTNPSVFSSNTVEAKAEDLEYFDSVYFYRFGDLLEAFLDVTSGKQTCVDENIKIFLGTCRCVQRFRTTGFKDYFDNREKQISYYSLYHIPIDREEYNNMINERYINKSSGRITFMSYFEGLMNIVKKYYVVADPILQPKTSHPARSVTMTMINATKKVGDKIKNGITLKDIKKLPPTIFNLSNNKKQEVSSIYVIAAGATAPSTSSKGENEKMYDTYRIGDAFSCVKRARFNRVQTATQKATESDNVAAVAESEAGGIIPHLFNIDLDMVGNVKFSPGYYFNLKPFAPILVNKSKTPYASQGILKKLGMDNLNVTIKVNHKIGVQGFETTLSSMAVQKNN